MSLDADAIVDRRRLRRKLTFWRVIAVVIAIAAVAVLAARLSGPAAGWIGAGSYIARINLTGLIRNDQDRVEALDRLAKSSAAKAVILHIDSPGGTTSGSEQLYDALIRLGAKKPLVVVVDGLAASGAYIAALAGERVFAQETSLVGSIGVLFQYPNVYELLNSLGIKVEAIKSSPLKAAPSGYEPTSPEARAAIEEIVKDSYAWFRSLVQSRRDMDAALLERVSDGRVFTGRQGADLKLIDEIGDERAAIAWLAKEKNIDAKTPVRDYDLRDRLRDLPFLHTMAVSLLDLAGLPALARRLEGWGTLQAVEKLNLDGLLALWHPPVSR